MSVLVTARRSIKHIDVVYYRCVPNLSRSSGRGVGNDTNLGGFVILVRGAFVMLSAANLVGLGPVVDVRSAFTVGRSVNRNATGGIRNAVGSVSYVVVVASNVNVS